MSKKFTQLKKELIRDTFIELLENQPIHKVTVAKVSQAAEISRSCFYRYYTDVYAILEEVEEANLEKIREYMYKRVTENVTEEDIANLFLFFYDNRLIHKVLLNNSHTYMSRWHDLIYDVYLEHYNRIGKELSLSKKWRIEYNVGGITGIVNHYITNGDTYTYEEIKGLVHQVKINMDE